MMKKYGDKDQLAKAAQDIWGVPGQSMRVFGTDKGKGKIEKEAYVQGSAATQFYSPRLTPDTWWLPRTRKMLLRWVKIFYDWDPYVNSILRMHARYPISEFNIVTDNVKQKEFLEAVLNQDDWNMVDIMREGSLSWYKNGEAICMGDWDEEKGYWKGFVWLDPGLIEIEEIPFSGKQKVYAEIPKKYIKLFKSNKPADTEKKKLMPKPIVEAITKGQKYIELDTQEKWDGQTYSPAKVCVMVNKSDVGENGLRGLPFITCLLKDLVFQDYLRKAQMSRAQRFAYPIEFWKIGDIANNILPDATTLDDVRKMLQEALASPPYTVIYTPLLSLEILGATGSLLPIYEDLNYVEDRLLVGLGTNKNIVLGEGGWMSNAKTLSMQRLIMDYQVDRDMWTGKFLKNFILRPICFHHGWATMDKYTQRKRPNMPKISWTRSLDIQQEEDTKRIYYDMWKDGLVSTQTLFDRFPDLNLKTEARNLEKEKGTIFDGGSRTLPAGTSTMDFDDDVPGASKGKPGSPLKPSRPVKPSSEEGVEETSPEGTTPEEIPPEGTPKPSQSLEPAEPGGEGPEEGRPV